jgi:alkane 1-monooxygenase
MLEAVNYLEHYGLRRQKLADGRYERVRASHSWNSNTIVANVCLFHLQRHSDHHAHPLRRYQTLRHADEAPQLPSGYATLMLIASSSTTTDRYTSPRSARGISNDSRKQRGGTSARHCRAHYVIDAAMAECPANSHESDMAR